MRRQKTIERRKRPRVLPAKVVREIRIAVCFFPGRDLKGPPFRKKGRSILTIDYGRGIGRHCPSAVSEAPALRNNFEAAKRRCPCSTTGLVRRAGHSRRL